MGWAGLPEKIKDKQSQSEVAVLRTSHTLRNPTAHMTLRYLCLLRTQHAEIIRDIAPSKAASHRDSVFVARAIVPAGH